ncbi:COG3014 family protein [Helicobacter baculiformis]|uniref:COG3014 family protein n=1 Tax=Helicobacter baculiformis TaxID=427351 RepID=A0ABV7ZH50_9HELI|nr:hypothetical protein [Helicobacter baculiformis]
MKVCRYLCLAFVVLLFVGCTGHRSEFALFDKSYYSPLGMQDAYAFSAQMSAKDHKDGSLWDLQNGLSALMLGQYQNSIRALNAAEKQFDHYINFFKKSVGNVGAVLVNDNVKTYTGSIYESVLMNYYKAMDYLLIGDPADARVEFNRANDRQRRAKEFYHKQIQKAVENMRKQGASRLSKENSESKVREVLNQDYSNLDRFAAYNDLINPAVSYLSGLFFALDNDRSRGIDYLKEAYGISHSITVGEDLLFFKYPSAQKFTWIFIEDGKQATKQEFKITLPLPLPDGIYTASLALPQLVDGVDFHTGFMVSATHQNKNFENLVVLDGIIGSEFKKQLPYIVTRAITSAVLKVGLEAISNQYLGILGGLFSSIYAAASTSADIRSPTIFPRKLYIARVSNTPNERVRIHADGQDIYSFAFASCHKTTAPPMPNTFCANKHNIIYIRSFRYTSIVKVLW